MNYSFAKEIKGKPGLIGRRNEIQMLKESLFKTRMKNTILIGQAGCGKTAIIEQFVYEMKHHYTFHYFNVGGCVAGTKYRGEFEERLVNFLEEIKKFNSKAENEKKIILFIDEIHTIYKAGGAEGAIDASNIFKPYLSQGDVIIIGATTPEEYEKTIKVDKALSRRLAPIYIDNLDDEMNLKILKNFAKDYKEITEDIINYIFEKSKELNGTNPDISIEILDRCIGKLRLTGEIINKKVINEIVKYMKR